MVDWAAISVIAAACLALIGALYGARKGDRSSDKDNRFQVLSNTVDQLQEQVKACQDREVANERRYRAQDDAMNDLRDRHQQDRQRLDDAQDELRAQRIRIASLERRLAAEGGNP